MALQPTNIHTEYTYSQTCLNDLINRYYMNQLGCRFTKIQVDINASSTNCCRNHIALTVDRNTQVKTSSKDTAILSHSYGPSFSPTNIIFIIWSLIFCIFSFVFITNDWCVVYHKKLEDQEYTLRMQDRKIQVT